MLCRNGDDEKKEKREKVGEKKMKLNFYRKIQKEICVSSRNYQFQNWSLAVDQMKISALLAPSILVVILLRCILGLLMRSKQIRFNFRMTPSPFDNEKPDIPDI
jgi:hypothetical protein